MINHFICMLDDTAKTPEECLACSLTGKNRCNLDYGILYSIVKSVEDSQEYADKKKKKLEKAKKAKKKYDKFTKKKKDKHPKLLAVLEKELKPHYSTTTITNICHRQKYLNTVLDAGDYPNKLWWLTRGTILHKVLERAGKDPNLITEQYIALEGKDFILSCIVDMYNKSIGELQDYKSSNSLYRTFKRGYMVANYVYWQVQINKSLWQAQFPELPVKRTAVTYFDLRGSNKLLIPMATEKDTRVYIRKQLPTLRNAFENGIVPARLKGYPNSWTCKDYCTYTTKQLCKKLGGKACSM